MRERERERREMVSEKKTLKRDEEKRETEGVNSPQKKYTESEWKTRFDKHTEGGGSSKQKTPCQGDEKEVKNKGSAHGGVRERREKEERDSPSARTWHSSFNSKAECVKVWRMGY